MGFVQRNGDGAIVGWFACQQPAPIVTEQVADDDPAVIAFLNPPAPVPAYCSTLGLKRAFDELGVGLSDAQVDQLLIRANALV
ncbi:hypothetical protein ACVW1C_000094 [Bradyrhizobium sp. USDA 4011]